MLNEVFQIALAVATSNGTPAITNWAKPLVPQVQIQKQQQSPTPPKLADSSGEGCIAIGTLSTYDWYYQGRQTASGEIFDQNQDTIAIWDDLPFGWYRLTNLDNGKSIRVYGNDKGAFKQLGRIADASAAAFSAISFSGTTDEGLLFNTCLSYD